MDRRSGHAQLAQGPVGRPTDRSEKLCGSGAGIDAQAVLIRNRSAIAGAVERSADLEISASGLNHHVTREQQIAIDR